MYFDGLSYLLFKKYCFGCSWVSPQSNKVWELSRNKKQAEIRHQWYQQKENYWVTPHFLTTANSYEHQDQQHILWGKTIDAVDLFPTSIRLYSSCQKKQTKHFVSWPESICCDVTVIEKFFFYSFFSKAVFFTLWSGELAVVCWLHSCLLCSHFIVLRGMEESLMSVSEYVHSYMNICKALHAFHRICVNVCGVWDHVHSDSRMCGLQTTGEVLLYTSFRGVNSGWHLCSAAHSTHRCRWDNSLLVSAEDYKTFSEQTKI